MIRGTTPTHIFKLPFDGSAVQKVMVIYAQSDKEIICKETNDCEITENEISVSLTQEETFLFSDKEHVQIQLRILTNAGKALASAIKVVDVEKCLNDEVL